MKKVFTLIALFVTINLQAQDADKTVTLTVTGQGKTIDEAKANALRGAIEQAFGAFVSSNTSILNDSLVKDEVVILSNGNIKNYDILSQNIVNDGSVIVTLKAMVSVTKLRLFSESKGAKLEFSGDVFAANMVLQDFYKKSEILALDNLFKIVDTLSSGIFDANIKVSNPILREGTKDMYVFPVSSQILINENFANIASLVHAFLKGVSLSVDQFTEYTILKKPIYSMIFGISEKDYGIYHLRNNESCKKINNLVNDLLGKAHSLFKINNGLNLISLSDDIIDKGIWDELTSSYIHLNPYIQGSSLYYLSYKNNIQSVPALIDNLSSDRTINAMNSVKIIERLPNFTNA